METQYNNCRSCSCVYEEYKGDKKSTDLKSLCRYYGFCGSHCWDKLHDKGKNKVILHSFLFGDKRKRNKLKIPKNYLKNI